MTGRSYLYQAQSGICSYSRENFISFNIFTPKETRKMNALISTPSQQDRQTASESLYYLNGIVEDNSNGRITIQIGEKGKTTSIDIPPKALEMLAVILSNMAEGKATSVVSADAELSTQQVADLLGVSRPYIVKLLEAGTIPFKKTGSHRRVLLEDILEYQNAVRQTRMKKLKFLAEQAQKLELGYE